MGAIPRQARVRSRTVEAGVDRAAAACAGRSNHRGWVDPWHRRRADLGHAPTKELDPSGPVPHIAIISPAARGQWSYRHLRVIGELLSDMPSQYSHDKINNSLTILPTKC